MQLVPIHEYNDCHEPAGQPTGGRFCTKSGWLAAGAKRAKALTDQKRINRLKQKLKKAQRQGDRIYVPMLKKLIARYEKFGIPSYVEYLEADGT